MALRVLIGVVWDGDIYSRKWVTHGMGIEERGRVLANLKHKSGVVSGISTWVSGGGRIVDSEFGRNLFSRTKGALGYKVSRGIYCALGVRTRAQHLESRTSESF